MAVPVGPIDYVPTPGYRGIINNISFLIANPCGANPWIYLETLYPVLGELLLELLSFGLSDILIGYAHPKPRRGWNRFEREKKAERRVGRDGKARRIRGFEIPEIGNEIGKRLPGSAFVKSVQTDGISHMLWVPIDLVERVAWYWMVADLAKDGTYNWASEIFKEQCLGGGGGSAAMSYENGSAPFQGAVTNLSTYGQGATVSTFSGEAYGRGDTVLEAGITSQWSVRNPFGDGECTVTVRVYEGYGTGVMQEVYSRTWRMGEQDKETYHPMGATMRWRARGATRLRVQASGVLSRVIVRNASGSSWATSGQG